jgi:hypothetical protein
MGAAHRNTYKYKAICTSGHRMGIALKFTFVILCLEKKDHLVMFFLVVIILKVLGAAAAASSSSSSTNVSSSEDANSLLYFLSLHSISSFVGDMAVFVLYVLS